MTGNQEGAFWNGSDPSTGMPGPSQASGTLHLRDAAPLYVATLRSGLSLILNGILLQIALGISLALVSVVLAFSKAGFPPQPGVRPAMDPRLTMAAQVILLIPALMVLMGYWRYATEDGGVRGQDPTGSSRSMIRLGAGATVVLALISMILSVLSAIMPQSVGVFLVTIGVAVISLIVSAALQAVTMDYTAWIAQRLMDFESQRLAKRNVWLVPVMTTVGLLLCGLGPLIALILYWNLLNTVRKGVKMVEWQQQAV